MRKLGFITILMLAIPGVLFAAKLQCSLPPGLSGAQLLSGGTEAMLEHINGQANARMQKLKSEYHIQDADGQTAKAEDGIKLAKKAYSDRIASLRKHYISLLNIELSAVSASINPSSSALGDVMYTYVARNSSDRIITDIVYKPIIGGKPLPTTTSLYLEFMDPQTLKSGLAPQETMTNKGHDQEKFSFFIGEISQAELKSLQKDFGKKFSINIIDMHFADQKGYKGQFKPKTFEEAFAGQLRPLEETVRKAETDERGAKDSDTKLTHEFTAQKGMVIAQQKKSLTELKKSSVRYTARADRKGRFIFEDIPAGTYYLYASKGRNKAVFEKITVGGDNLKQAYTTLKKDPFEP